MKTEELTVLGLTEEQAKQVLAINGKDIEKHKGAIQTLEAERNGLKDQLSEASGKLAGYDPEWKQKAQQAQAEAEQKIAALRFDSLLDSAIGTAKGRSAKAIKALLDTPALAASKNQSEDVKAALEALKTDSGYLFEEETPAPQFAGPTPGGEAGNPLDGMSYSQMKNYLEAHPGAAI